MIEREVASYFMYEDPASKQSGRKCLVARDQEITGRHIILHQE